MSTGAIRRTLYRAVSAIQRRLVPADVTRAWENIRYRDPQWTLAKLKLGSGELDRPYQQHETVYSCMSLIAEAAADIPFRIYRGDEENYDEVTKEPIARLFDRPNTYWSKAHWVQAAIIQLLRDGNAIFVWDRDRDKQEPRQFYVYGKDGWDPIFKGDSRDLDHWDWEVRRDGKPPITRRVETFQATPAMTYNPHHEFWGMGPMQVASIRANHDFLAQKLTDAWFRNSGQPGGVVSFQRSMTPEQLGKYREQLSSTHTGSLDKWFQMLVLEGAATYTPIPLNYQQMQFVEQQKMSDIKIAGIFHVPPILLSIMDETHKATAAETYKEFYSKAVLPLCRIVKDALNAQFFDLWNKLNGDSLWCGWDITQIEALQEGRNEKVTRATALFGIGFPRDQINEIEELGYEPTEDGEVGYLPMGMLPVDADRSMPALPTPEPDEDEEDGDGASPKALLSPKTTTECAAKRTPTQRQPNPRLLFQPGSIEHERVYREWIQRIIPLEQDYARRLRTYLQQVRSFLNLKLDAAMDRFDKTGEIPRDFFDLDVSFDENLRKISAKHFKRVTIEVAPIVESHINGARIPFVFNPKDPRIAEFLKTKEIKIVENVNGKGLREAARKALTEQQRLGTGFGELHEALNDVVGDNRRRALTIARTETAQCANGVEFEAEQSAGVSEHMWVATLDDRVRETHVDMMLLGAIPINSMFPNGCRYPGDVDGPPAETINCRCTMMAVA
jgi:HK97 family phage portal protein